VPPIPVLPTTFGGGPISFGVLIGSVLWLVLLEIAGLASWGETLSIPGTTPPYCHGLKNQYILAIARCDTLA
jgi:hypothetical protein